MTDYAPPRFATQGHKVAKSERHTHTCPHCFQQADFCGYAHHYASKAYSCRHCLRAHYVRLMPPIVTDEFGQTMKEKEPT